MKDRQKAYNEANKEKIKERKHQWHEANKERLKQLDVEFRKTRYKHYTNQNIGITTLRSNTNPTIRILYGHSSKDINRISQR